MTKFLQLMKTKLKSLALRVLLWCDPEYSTPVRIITSPQDAVQRYLDATDKLVRELILTEPTPADSLAIIQYRAGAKRYRQLIMNELSKDANPKTQTTS